MAEQALNQTQKAYMYHSGFLPYEIAAFAHAQTPDGHQQLLSFNSKPFQAMIYDRIDYFTKMHRAGWNDLQIKSRILMLYATKRGKASPWDFLKIEYQPIKPMTDTVWAVKLKAKARITRTLGAGYGTKMRKELRPRYAPVVRELPAKPRG